MNPSLLAPEYIRNIAPYQPGKPISDVARELGMAEADIIKLASNENPLGPSPKALEAIRHALPDLALYPDGGGFALKEVICRKFGVLPQQVILGNGSNDVLELAARTFLTAGTSAVYSQHTLAVCPGATLPDGAAGTAGGDSRRYPHAVHGQSKQPHRHVRACCRIARFSAAGPGHGAGGARRGLRRIPC